MTNLLLKRLVTKGYLRVRQLDRKKIEYLLTVRGLSQKARKTYYYTLKTLESFGLIRRSITDALNPHLLNYNNQVYVLGDGDLASFTMLVLKDQMGSHASLTRIDNFSDQIEPGSVVVNTSQHRLDPVISKCVVVDMREVLQKGGVNAAQSKQERGTVSL